MVTSTLRDGLVKTYEYDLQAARIERPAALSHDLSPRIAARRATDSRFSFNDLTLGREKGTREGLPHGES